MIRSVLPVRDVDGSMKIQVIFDHGGCDYYTLNRYAGHVWIEQLAVWLRESERDTPQVPP